MKYSSRVAFRVFVSKFAFPNQPLKLIQETVLCLQVNDAAHYKPARQLWRSFCFACALEIKLAWEPWLSNFSLTHKVLVTKFFLVYTCFQCILERLH